MKFCLVVPEICHGQVHASWKERIRIIIIKIKIIIRNGAKTISPPNFVWETITLNCIGALYKRTRQKMFGLVHI
jgi:hypothetical protein